MDLTEVSYRLAPWLGRIRENERRIEIHAEFIILAMGKRIIVFTR
jgi:hypothetical protein